MEDAGDTAFSQWATNISPGADNESDQILIFSLTATNQSLFSELPDIDPDTGTLTFTPESNVFGSSVVRVSLFDNSDGTNTSQSQTFTITILSVNDAPSFTLGENIAVKQNTLKRVENWAKNVSPGPSNESEQSLTFYLNSSPENLFQQLPEVDAQTGTLTFQTATSQTGTATIHIFLADSGDGAYTSGESVFTIEVTTSDPPVISGLEDLHIAQNSIETAIFSVTDTETADNAIAVSAKSSNTDLVTNDNIQIITQGSDRQMTITPETKQYGTALITVYANDGSTTSQSQFELIVHPTPKASIGLADDAFGYTSGTVPLSVHFTPTELEHADEITGWKWEFSDGGIRTTSDPVYTFYLNDTSPSLYSVQLTVYGYDNVSYTTSLLNYIQVEEKKSILVMADPTNGSIPLEVSFDQIVTGFGDDPHYTWKFGDGENSNESKPRHTYIEPGNYTVSLSVSDGSITQTQVTSNFIQVAGRQIMGQITASDSGKGLANCIVDIWHDDKGLIASETTNANGNYLFQGLPAQNNLIVVAWPSIDLVEQYENVYYDNADTRESSTRVSTWNNDLQNIDICLQLAPQSGIRGRLLLADNPDQGISQVSIQAYSEKLGTGTLSTTDINGNYTLTGLKPSDDYIVSAWKQSWQNEFFYAATDPNDPESFFLSSRAEQVSVTETYVNDINIYITFTGCVSGQVFADGQPIDNVWVTAIAQELDWFNGTLSNNFGAYTICGLVETRDGVQAKYRVYISSSDYPFIAYNQATTFETGDWVTMGQTNINFHMQTGSNISGTVIDTNGNAISDASIWVSSASKGSQGTATSDALGNFTIANMPLAKDYLLRADAMNFPVVYFNDAQSPEEATQINNSKGNVDNLVVIMKKRGVIQGYVKVYDALQSAGAGYWVNLWSASLQTAATCVTDSQGTYEFTGLDENISDYIISITNTDDFMPAYYHSQETVYQYNDAERVQPSETLFRNIVLIEGYSVSGKVVDINNTLISDIMVSAVAADSGGWGYALTDKKLTNGYNYRITALPSGTYNICVDSDDYLKQCKTMAVSEDKQGIDFQLYESDRKISGTIYGLKAGQRIELWAYSSSSNMVRKKVIYGTGNDIDYELRGLPAFPDFILELISSQVPYQVYNNQKNRNNADLIDLSTKGQTGIDFNVASANITLSGDIIFPTTTPQSAWVDVSDSQFNWIKGTYIQYTGINPVSFEVSGLEKGMYIVSVWPSQGMPQYYQNSASIDEAKMIDATSHSVDHIDFSIQQGASISGYVYDNSGQPVADIDVFIFSKYSGNWGHGQTDNDGFYQVNGLEDWNDYIVEVRRGNYPPIYYSTTGIVMDESLASLVPINSDQINMTYYQAESISGAAFNTQRQPLSGILIFAESESRQVFHACYTNSDGTFQLEGLPGAFDYFVSAEPSGQSIYQGQQLSNIATGTNDLYLMLSAGYKLKGWVSSENEGSPIPDVYITISSISMDIFKRVKSNSQGEYEISGLSSGRDYAMTATPPENSSYASYQETDILINADTTKNINLPYGLTISGHVMQSDLVTPIANILITAFSQGQNYMASSKSNADGSYTIYNLPSGTDYLVIARPEDYAEKSVSNQSAGSVVNFFLDQGGMISGYVSTSDGVYKGASVEACSSLLNMCQVASSNSKGYYEINGLQQYWHGSLVDYVLTVYAAAYPNMTATQKHVGDSVNFTLSRGTENEMSGTVSDSTGALLPENGETVWVKVYLDGKYVTKTKVNKDGSGTFTMKGLQAGVKYQVKVKAPTFDQEWVGADGMGTLTNAAEFTTEDEILFRFSSGTW